MMLAEDSRLDNDLFDDNSVFSQTTNDKDSNIGGGQTMKKRKIDQVIPDLTQNNNNQQQQHVLLRDLSMALNQAPMWTIKTRVIFKSPLGMTSNNKSTVLNLKLADEQGSVVRAFCFNESALHYFDELQLDQIYIISKANVRQNTSIHNNDAAPNMVTAFDLEFDLQSTKIIPSRAVVANEDLFKLYAPPVTPADISTARSLRLRNPLPTGNVNMIGIVVAIGTVQTTANGKQKYDVILMDHGGEPYAVTVWSHFELIKGLCIGRPLLLRSLRIGQYNGKLQFTASYETMVEELTSLVRQQQQQQTVSSSMETERAQRTAAIYQLLFDSALTKSLPSVADLTRLFASSRLSSRCSFQEMLADVQAAASSAIKTVADIYTELAIDQSKLPMTFKVCGYIRAINMNRTLYYMACPLCRKKMIEPVSGQYQCQNTPKCLEQPPNTRPNVTYSMSVTIGGAEGDGAVLENCMCFGEIGVLLLGIPAQTICDNKQNLDSTEFTSWWTDSILKPILSTLYEFKITASVDENFTTTNAAGALVKRIQYRILSLTKTQK